MEMSTEEILWAGLQAGPVHVLQHSKGREQGEVGAAYLGPASTTAK